MINTLIEKSLGGLVITINGHKSVYETVEKYLDMARDYDIKLEVYKKMIELDTIIEIQFYPDTPIGFYKIYHYDFNLAIEEALRIKEQ